MKSRYPTRIGRYEVIDRLGVGGMGAVYLASDPSLGRTVAIKILNSDEDELQERFEREARSAASLRHQHIVTIYDIGEHEGRPFLAMEFLDGESMAEMIRRRMPLALDARLDLFCQLCSGLGYAHRRGIIHRDIKPANLMITSERVLKIVDFGLARLATGGSTMTRAGTLMGTPNYMSPEQAQGATVDHLSDIFSTGLVFYELISYRRAYAGDSTPAILHNIVHGEPEPISSVLPDIDPELEQVVRKAIEKPKERRYQQLGELAIDVERIRQRLHAQSTVEGATVVIERPSTELETGGPPLEGGSRRASKPPSSYVGRTSPEARRNLDAIAQRRIAQIAQRVAAAAEHAEAGRLQEAVEECEQALLLDPQDARARQLLEQVHEAMAERQISALVEQARSELSQGALTLAGEHVEQALQVRSDSPQARGLREQIREKRRRRERDAERVRNVQAAMERAERNLQEGALEAAVRGALEALGYDRENQKALALRDRALAAIEERRVLAYERAAQEALADARHQADAGNYNQALALLRSFTPQHAEVDKAILDLEVQLAAVERQRREEELRAQQRAAEELRRQRQRATLRQVAHRALDGGDWAAARAATRAAREAFPGDPDIDRLCQEIEDDAEKRETAARLQEAARLHLEAAESALAAGDLDAAHASVELSLGLLPTHARAVRLQTKINERIARAEQERLARERAEQAQREQERIARERAEEERLARERAEQERLEQERLARERAEQERLERERAEQAQREQERIARERAEEERLARERAEQERLEQERLARERAEQERLEQERLERERAEQEQREQERIARERAEEERLARERAEQERAEQERLARKRAERERREQERLERERAEQEQSQQERMARERAEEERLARERAEQERAEQERLARERAEQERLERERLERERAEQEQREQERIARERAEEERLARERAEQERAEQERLEQERLTRERAEQERRERERLERERAEQEQREQERIAQERAEQERLARKRAEEERLEQERLARERAERERREQERLERERAAQEQRAQERIAQERAEEERLARERAEQERAEQERLTRERAEQERLERERLEHERAEQERLTRERAEQERAARERDEQERLARQREEQERIAQERAEQKRIAAERKEQVRAAEKRAKQERQAEKERLRRERQQQKRDQEAALASQRQEESTDLSAGAQEAQPTQADELELAEPIAQTEIVSPAAAAPTLLSTPVTVVDVPTAIDDRLARAQRHREAREYDPAFELLAAVLVDRAADPAAVQLRTQIVNDVREALRQDPANARLQSLLARYGTEAPRQRWLTQALVAAAALAVITTLGLFLYNRAPVGSVEGPRTATPTTVPETAPPTDKPVVATPVPELPPAPPAIVETVVTINLLPWARVEITAADPTVKVPSGPHLTPFVVLLPPGDYTLRAENGGLTPERVLPLTVGPGKPITISETMPGFNAGRIVDTLLGAQR